MMQFSSVNDMGHPDRMNPLARLRTHTARWGGVAGVAFLAAWLGLVVAPCAMAMDLPAPADAHDCPHCPPQPCHEAAGTDCDPPDSLDAPRAGDDRPALALLPAVPVVAAADAAVRTSIRSLSPPARAGPRLHLIHTRFDE